MTERERICWGCREMHFLTSSPGYSELTPGTDFQMYCYKGHWKLDTDSDGREQLRTYLLMAETCPDWEPAS